MITYREYLKKRNARFEQPLREKLWTGANRDNKVETRMTDFGEFLCNMLANCEAVNIIFEDELFVEPEEDAVVAPEEDAVVEQLEEERIKGKKIKLQYSDDKKWMRADIEEKADWDWDAFFEMAANVRYLVVQGYDEKISDRICGMEKLRYLELVNCVVEDSIENIEKLELLELLCLDESEIREIPSGIVKLGYLTVLSLRGTDIETLPDALGELSTLTYLNLNGTKIKEVPEVISELLNLKGLFLGQTKINMIPDSIQNLKKLERLALWETDISSLPDWVCEFKKLRGLYLGRSRGICKLPEGIGNLKRLEEIYLDGTGLEELPEGFKELNRLSRVTMETTRIRKLLLADTLPNLRNCTLNDMVLERIPRQLINENMGIHVDEKYGQEGLFLHNTKTLCQPISLFSHDREFITAYYEEEKIHLNETKVVFLGDGEAGKSHIIRRMQSDGELLEHFWGEATPGIAISQKYYQIDHENVCLQIWDFGGQEIMHSMHRFFLTERTLYVIVVNARDNTQDERAKYWLNNIKSFANGCPVILVLNKMDQNPAASINERLLMNDYPQIIKTLKLSALKDEKEKFEQLVNTILEAVKNFDSYAMEFPVSWNSIKNRLTEMESNYIVDPEYRSICREYHVEDEQIQDWLLDWFHDLGVSFNYHKRDELLGGYMVLKPQWITNAIYIILFNGRDLTNNGIMKINDMVALLKAPLNSVEKISYNITEVPYILGVMRRFEISYSIDDENEFIPMMCQKNQHEEAENFMVEDSLEYFMEYEYLPNNVLHKLMIRMRDDLVTDKIWLTGMILETQTGGVSALVRMHDKRLEIFVKSKDVGNYPPKEYLAEIRRHLLVINQELNLTAEDMIVYKEEGIREEIKYNILLIYISENRYEYFSPVFRKPILVKRILGIVEKESEMELIIHLCKENNEMTSQILLNILEEKRATEIAQKDFEKDLIEDCIKLQGNTLLIQQGKENDRNTYLRDLLSAQKYIVADQTLNGKSPEGKASGELDLLIKNRDQSPFAILEALNLDFLNQAYIANHINKIYDYDTWGLPVNYILIYANVAKFADFCKKYKEFIKTFDYPHPAEDINEYGKYADIRMFETILDRSDRETRLIHVIVKI